jgi:3-dehydroquinate synthase
VIIDIDTLNTLPPREIRSGFAEIAKHGLIADAAYFEHVTSRHFDAWSPEELSEIIFRSCQIKQQIVQSDESEQGARKTLNFGHTVGHAVEALSLESDNPLTHGEAVAIGMLAEARISHHAGLLSEEELERIKVGLKRVGLPTTIPETLDPLRLRSLMAQDKKNVAGQIRWTLLKSIGQAVYDQGCDDQYIAETLLSSSDS